MSSKQEAMNWMMADPAESDGPWTGDDNEDSMVATLLDADRTVGRGSVDRMWNPSSMRGS